jgi:transposase
MTEIVTIGIDLAKNVFQIHGVDAAGAVVVRRKLRRSQMLTFFATLEPCLIGMEACAGAHFWARELTARGHEARLMPAAYVKPYVKRGKTDAADAEAICEAVRRPTMRFVPMKSAERQAALLDHKSREFLVRQRTQIINAIRDLTGLTRPHRGHGPGSTGRVRHRRCEGYSQHRPSARHDRGGTRGGVARARVAG